MASKSETVNRLYCLSNNSDSEANKQEENDFCQYGEEIAEEESENKRRCDPVENHESEMPEGIEDGDIESDAGHKHLKMVEGITGVRGEAFNGEGGSQVILSDLQGDLNNGKLGSNDLSDPLYGNSDHGEQRKSGEQLHVKPRMDVDDHGPLSKWVRLPSGSYVGMCPNSEVRIWKPEGSKVLHYDEVGEYTDLYEGDEVMEIMGRSIPACDEKCRHSRADYDEGRCQLIGRIQI